ncbi:MAG: LysR family transcriptional regulator [Pseudomonadota bacterium]|nr:LysR family transcriptional regulator [Pseudomonadota bacterium]
MSEQSRRPLSLGALRSFEAVARRLNFSAAAAELFVTQSAVSRQIKSLEDELGAALFVRGTRHVELTDSGQTLWRALAPGLAAIDTSVRQIRSVRRRKRVSITTFASFASMWLLPRIEAFQREHADIDIRVSAADAFVDLDDPEIDLALRHCPPGRATAGAARLFGEVLTPVIGRSLAERIASGAAPALADVADLAQHTLAEEDGRHNGSVALSWRRWLELHGAPELEPRRWLYLSFASQQVQAALAGQGVALARMALVGEVLERGELLEPFGREGRIGSRSAYWMLMAESSRGGLRPEVAQFRDWVLLQAAETRTALDEAR